MPEESAPSCLLLGRLQRDTIINAQGRIFVDKPGGNLLYAAAAYRLWGDRPALLSRVGSDFPSEWLQDLDVNGFDMRGIVRTEEAQDLRRFIAYSDVHTVHRENPIKYFAEQKQPIPKSLLGYKAQALKLDSKRQRTALSLRGEDIPDAFHGAKAAHLCPLDYISHSLMPAALREVGVQTITLDAGRGYMHPSFWDEIAELVNGLTVFLVNEVRLKALFAGRNIDIWEMMASLASFNCRAVVVHSINRGQWLLDADRGNRFHVPPYPSRLVDITNAGSSFCGAFVSGLQRTQDLLRSVLYGNAISSIATEGSGAFYVADSLPGLAESRLQSLLDSVQTI